MTKKNATTNIVVMVIHKTQIFEELTKDDVKECNIETINTRSEPLHLINVKEATIDRFDWLHYSPQQHTINNDAFKIYIQQTRY